MIFDLPSLITPQKVHPLQEKTPHLNRERGFLFARRAEPAG
jgi:hypothetical protein